MKSTSLLLFRRFLSAAALCALLGATAHAQAPAAPGAAPAATPAARPKPLAYTDDTFVRNTAKSLNYLIQLANAAKTSVTDPNLSRLRDTTATDLGTALTEIKKIADAHGTKLAADVGGTEKFDLDRLSKVKPDKFPKEWVAALAKETKRLDHEVEMNGKTVQDDDLKTFVTNYTPLIHGAFTSAEAADKAAKAPQKH